jgi:hypothetical protein
VLNAEPILPVTPELYAIFRDWFTARGSDKVPPILLLDCRFMGGPLLKRTAPPPYQVESNASQSLCRTV